MSAMERMWKRESNKDLQLHMNFNKDSFKEDLAKKMSEIAKRFPYAKLNPGLVSRSEKGEWLFNGRSLENEAMIAHEAYKPDPNEDWRNK